MTILTDKMTETSMKPKRDSEIEQCVLRELRLEKGLGSREICVFSCDGVVTLKGSVRTSSNKVAAQEATRRVADVVTVLNEITVESHYRLNRRFLNRHPKTTPRVLAQSKKRTRNRRRESDSHLRLQNLTSKAQKQPKLFHNPNSLTICDLVWNAELGRPGGESDLPTS